MHKKPFLMVAALVSAVALSAVLAWMITDRAAILRDGREIVLKTEPVDPRDLLRGRYVRLNYTISNIPNVLFDLDEDMSLDSGAIVFVRLEEGANGYWKAVAAASVPPPETDEAVWIRGTARYGVWPASESVTIEYGIERFYLPEPDAPEIEKRMRNRVVTDIAVAVGADGRAQIKALRQGSDTIYTERLF